jgi:hypothetical protein
MRIVEVFKTNVDDPFHAGVLIDLIHKTFTGYTANFDLEDCDRILRVKCASGSIQSVTLIKLLGHLGCQAEILSDEDQPVRKH